MTIIITSPSTGVTELTSEPFQAEGDERMLQNIQHAWHTDIVSYTPSLRSNHISRTRYFLT